MTLDTTVCSAKLVVKNLYLFLKPSRSHSQSSQSAPIQDSEQQRRALGLPSPDRNQRRFEASVASLYSRSTNDLLERIRVVVIIVLEDDLIALLLPIRGGLFNSIPLELDGLIPNPQPNCAWQRLRNLQLQVPPTSVPQLRESVRQTRRQPSAIPTQPTVQQSGANDPRNAEYIRQRDALGANATKAERDVVRDAGLAAHKQNFPQFYKDK